MSTWPYVKLLLFALWICFERELNASSFPCLQTVPRDGVLKVFNLDSFVDQLILTQHALRLLL